MTWPQWYVVAFLVVAFAVSVRDHVRDRTADHIELTIRIFVTASYLAAFVYVLHRGGFW